MNRKNKSKFSSENKFKLNRQNYRVLIKNTFNLENNNEKDVKTNAINVWGIYYGVIYRIIDTANSKVYIGQTIQALSERFRQHFKAPPNKYLAQAIFQHKKNFKIVKNGIINNQCHIEQREENS